MNSVQYNKRLDMTKKECEACHQYDCICDQTPCLNTKNDPITILSFKKDAAHLYDVVLQPYGLVVILCSASGKSLGELSGNSYNALNLGELEVSLSQRTNRIIELVARECGEVPDLKLDPFKVVSIVEHWLKIVDLMQ